MSLLELEHISKRLRRGSRIVLEDLSLALDAGEMVAVWGERRSGRSTLLRVCAGVERPDAGVVRFAGRDLADRAAPGLGVGIGYCRWNFPAVAEQTVLDLLLAVQYARRVPRSAALRRGGEVLRRVGAEACVALRPDELDVGESVRVAVARALTSDPRLLVIDEPTLGVELSERDRILLLLRSLADEGVAVLTSTAEGTGLLGADRVLSLGNGKLRGALTPELAPVADLCHRRQSNG
jgi:multiple sugar transport system ATP-binding protein